MDRIKYLLLLTFVTVIAASMISCSDETEKVTAENNPLSASLIGCWYGEYTAEGETTESANSVAGTYIKAVQGLEFKADGTGTCTKFLCNVASEPLSIYGGEMDQSNGRFHYTSDADGTINITRDGQGTDGYPKTWTMKLANGVLSGNDGGTAFQLKTADQFQKATLTSWEDQLRNGGNSDTKSMSFLKDWENCEKVLISGSSEPKYLPWVSYGKSDIPEDIMLDCKKANGWEMAFCCLNDPAADKTRYFGLYNRYKGILRIFMYIPDAASYGNEMAFDIACGTRGTNRYPFFNSMAYAVPANLPYSKWETTVRLSTGTSTYSPLSWCQTPYTEKATANGVSTYWHCFDIDMSGYSPENTSVWKSHIDNNQELLSFNPISQSTTDVKLTGTLMGKLGGTFSNPKMVSSPVNPDLHRAKIAMNAIGSIFFGSTTKGAQGASVWKVFGDGEGNGKRGKALAWSTFGFGLLGAACNTVGGILSEFDKVETKEVEPGRIDLQLNANIDLTGVMKQWKSVTDGGLRLTPKLLKESNPECHIGEGCFSLATSPVVYVSKEDLMSEATNVNLTIVGDKYSAGNDDENERYALRFVHFLDPSSIKINLNTKIYHDITNVRLIAFCAVNTSMESGYTDSYRQLMKLQERPTFPLSNKTAGTIPLHTKSSPVRLHVIPRDTLLKDDPITHPEGVKSDSVMVVKQAGKDIYRYYGAISRQFGYGIMVEPQPYLPFNGYDFKKVVVPDLIVTVAVKFDCREQKNLTFIKQYIPEFRLVTHNELATYYQKLKAYDDKCEKNQPVDTLANSPVKVYSNSHIYLARTINMLQRLTKK